MSDKLVYTVATYFIIIAHLLSLSLPVDFLNLIPVQHFIEMHKKDNVIAIDMIGC